MARAAERATVQGVCEAYTRATYAQADAEDVVEQAVQNFARRRTADGWTLEKIGEHLTELVREIVTAAE